MTRGKPYRLRGWQVLVVSLALMVCACACVYQGADRAARARHDRIVSRGCQERAWCWGSLGVGDKEPMREKARTR